MDLFITELGFEKRAVEEIGREGSRVNVIAPGLLFGESKRVRPLVFVRQILPSISEVAAPSIAEWAAHVVRALPKLEASWELHIFALAEEKFGPTCSSRRTGLIRERVVQDLKKKRRTALRLLIEHRSAAEPVGHTVQLLLASRTEGYLSIAKRNASLSPFPGGRVAVSRDLRPPSRAYEKLLEAEMRFGVKIERGDTVVDLGASPGGWSYVGAERGARVTAVDRSPLRSDLMERIEFIKGDGFKFLPDRAVDWLLCDMIAFPDRSISLLEEWVRRALCRRFVVTIKFRGKEDYDRLDGLKSFLARHTKRSLLTHLSCNKNEVTACGEI